MKQKRTRRGVHERIQLLHDDGTPVTDLAELTKEEVATIRSVGFSGLTDFLSKAEQLADEQLVANGLPTDWPRPTKTVFAGDEFDAWEIPQECEPAALTGAPVNGELAAKLKRDIHLCREHLRWANARAKIKCGERDTPLSPEQQANESMYFGTIVALSYWSLRANVLFEIAVSEKERRIKAGASPVTDEEIRVELRRQPTKADAATALGMTERQIDNRIPATERKQIRQERDRRNRKS